MAHRKIALAVFLVIVLAACGQPTGPKPTPLPTPIPTRETGAFRLHMPIVQQGWDWGPGVAGCAAPETLQALGVDWCYNWSPNCLGNPMCVPMIRTAMTPQAIEDTLRSCGGVCRGLLLFNEVGFPGQDTLSLEQMVQITHDAGQVVQAVDPSIQVFVGGFWTPHETGFLMDFARLYRTTYPGETIPVKGSHVHLYPVDCLTFKLRELSGCQGGLYPSDPQAAHDLLLNYVEVSRDELGPDSRVIVSEWGFLYPNEEAFKVWAEAHIPWFMEQRGDETRQGYIVGDAPFLCGNGQGYCCQLCENGQPTNLGIWYAQQEKEKSGW